MKTNVSDDFLIIVMNKEVRLRSGVKLLSASNLFSLLEQFDTTDLTGDMTRNDFSVCRYQNKTRYDLF